MAQVGVLGICLLSLCGCEIVQSNIPITFDEGESVAADAGDPGIPPYTGTACGAASATLCTVSLPADAGGEAGLDASMDAEPADAASDASGDDAAGVDAAGVDAGLSDAGSSDAAPLDAAPNPPSEPLSEWCALRCIKRCGSGTWECNGPLVCGVGEPPPSCGLFDTP